MTPRTDSGDAEVFGYGGRRRRVPPVGKCYAAYGTTACGFNCVAAYGEIRCARTPYGACAANYGVVRCADPSDQLIDDYDDERIDLPMMSCRSAYGEVVCGYHCVANYGQVKCAISPGRTCIANYGEVKCGYGCAAGYGEVRCSANRGGSCIAAYGRVTCS